MQVEVIDSELKLMVLSRDLIVDKLIQARGSADNPCLIKGYSFDSTYIVGGQSRSFLKALEYVTASQISAPNGYSLRFEDCCFDGVSSEQATNNVVKTIFFKGCVIKNLRFEPANVSFDGCEFDDINFTFNPHEDGVVFINCEFIRKLNARYAKFMDKVSFIGCKFIPKVLLGQDQDLDFSNAIFSKTTTFRSSVFGMAPKFYDAKLYKDTDFQDVKFLPNYSVESRRAWAVLKGFCMENHCDFEAQIFHAQELEARLKIELPKWFKIVTDGAGFETISSYVLKGLTSYGRDLWLPLLWLIVVSEFFAFFYLFNSGGVVCVNPEEQVGWVKDLCNVSSPSKAFFYSVRNFFGPIGLAINDDAILPANIFVKFLGFFHLLISSVIWFLWVLQIRLRFKL